MHDSIWISKYYSISINHQILTCPKSFSFVSFLVQCTYINGSPQNTFVPGCVQLAEKHNVFLGGDDFKSGQTKMKSVLVDFLVSAGLKVGNHMHYQIANSPLYLNYQLATLLLQHVVCSMIGKCLTTWYQRSTQHTLLSCSSNSVTHAILFSYSVVYNRYCY